LAGISLICDAWGVPDEGFQAGDVS